MLKISKNVLNFNHTLSKSLITSFLHTTKTEELILKEYGNADTSLELKTSELQIDLKPEELLVKLIASPINPADINIIQGKYGILPESLPATIGNEGIFEVVETTSKKFAPGDFVWKMGWGAWRSHIIDKESQFYKIDGIKHLNKHALATLRINPPTALRLLHDFVSLKPGDTVIQNGANSGVGQAVIQLANILNINLVNIVRKRENQDELTAYLKDLGAKYVFTEEDLRKSAQLTRDLWQHIPRPKLALNCVSGKATTDMIRLLDKESAVVTYGGMSKQPMTLNTADFIFKDLKCYGFWFTRWRDQHPKEEYLKTLQYFCKLIENKQFKAPKCEEFKLRDFKEAFKRAQTPFVNSKILFVN